MKKRKTILFILIYGIISVIVALFLFMRATISIYDVHYGIQHPDRKTAECPFEELNGYGISKMDIAKQVYMVAQEDCDEMDSQYDVTLFERMYSSDYAIKEGCVKRENAYIYTTKTGEHGLTNGVWHDVVHGNDRGNSGIDHMAGLVDLRACVLSGYGADIYHFLCDYPGGSIRVDKYAKHGAVIYPMQLTFLDENHNEVNVIACSNKEDISKLQVVEANDDWLLCENSIMEAAWMKESFERMKMITGNAYKYAEIISRKLDYSRDHCEKGYYKITRNKVVNYIAFTQGGFGYVHVEVIQDPRVPWGVGVAVFILWLINFIIMIKQYKGKTHIKE
ncbi:MAG: hypothetical protein Q4D51_02705 [Eubacteriales bacterium]|nr:hypothetical protein [Eubacteriales bacterium]